ncbi:hypothetical protein Bca101_039230 [Brassica carinata]
MCRLLYCKRSGWFVFPRAQVLRFTKAKFYYIAANTKVITINLHVPYLVQSNHWRCRDKQDSCLNQVHGVCFGMRLRQEPSPGFTAGRQYKTTDSSIAKGSYFQPYWTHTSSRDSAMQFAGDSAMQPLYSTWDLQLHHHPPRVTNAQRFTLRAPLNPKPQQVVAQTVAYEVSPSSSMTVGVRQLDPAEPK